LQILEFLTELFITLILANSGSSRGRNFNLIDLNGVSNFSWRYQLLYDILFVALEWNWEWLDYVSQNGLIQPPSLPQVFNWPKSLGKFFIMSKEFNKNISDWSHSRTDHKNGIDFFIRLVKVPKIAVKKCQNLIFKVDFQRQKPSESFQRNFLLENINLGAHFLFLPILCSMKTERLLFLKFLKFLAFIKFRWHDEKLTWVF
jgi:hypothetical protein